MINTWCSFISDNYDIIFVQATRDLRPDSLSWVDFVHLHNICNDKETKAEVSSRIFTTFVERNVKVITCIGNWQSFTAELKANRMFSSFVASKRSKILSSDVFVVGILRKKWLQWSHLLRNSKSNIHLWKHDDRPLKALWRQI